MDSGMKPVIENRSQAESPITEQMSRILAQVSTQMEIIKYLEEKLQPITSPEPTESNTVEAPEDREGLRASSLTNELWYIANRLERNNAALKRVIDRVEI